MGIDAQIVTEDGIEKEILLDPQKLTAKLVAEIASTSSRCLAFVDPYGDTIFNHLQIPVLIDELQVAIDRTQDQKAREHGSAAIALAKRAMVDVHDFVKFIGD